MSIESRSRHYGRLFGEWNVESLLGTGSNGKSAVFLLRKDNSWSEECALKVISLIEERGQLDSLPAFRREEYLAAAQALCDNAGQEVRLMNQLRGKTNIVDYLDHRFHSWEDETGFGVDLLIRMEKLRDLRGEINEGKIFPETEIIQLGMDICRALILCHGKNILHRDIKPENIFISQDRDFKLGDFGIARIMSNSPVSRASTGIGTAAYSAPEQGSGGYDERVDIYSLGLVLYELLNGNHLPFADSTYVKDHEIQLRLSGVPLPPPQRQCSLNATAPIFLSPLASVVLKACAFRPEDRYSSAHEMLHDLERIMAGLPITPPVTQPPAPPRKPIPPTIGIPPHSVPEAPLYIPQSNPRRNKLPASVVIPIILFLVVFTGVVLGYLFRHKHTWIAATCTDARTCTDCGATSGEPIGHYWLEATCTSPRTCSVCGVSSGSPLPHSWLEADCLHPRTCSECQLVQGEPEEHQWTEATCTQAKTCTACGTTQGNPLGHDWQQATCTEPMLCRSCFEQTGSPLGHVWMPATRYCPSTCDRCLAITGSNLSGINLNVEQSINPIRECYTEITNFLVAGEYEQITVDYGVFTYHFEDESLLYVYVDRLRPGVGSESDKYSRRYYFKDGELLFVLYEGNDSHRMYFYNGELIRWRYRPEGKNTDEAINYDLLNNSEYRYWENLALTEAARFQAD